MAATKRTPDQVIADRQTIAERYLRGDYQADIARDLGVTRQQVGYDLQAIRAAWLNSAIRDFDAAKAIELAKIDLVEREYWQAWERSQLDKEVEISGVNDGKRKEEHRREGQAGNPAFLAGVLTCIERRCAILGLDAPRRFVIDWESLTPDQEAALARGDAPEKVLSA